MPLCVILPGGVQNCDYQWTQIQDRDTFESAYLMYEGKDDPQKVEAFTVMSEQKVFFYNSDIEVAAHELEHVHCNLLNKLTEEKQRCNILVDMQDTLKHARGNIDPTPEPPRVTAEMQRSQFYSTPYVL